MNSHVVDGLETGLAVRGSTPGVRPRDVDYEPSPFFGLLASVSIQFADLMVLIANLPSTGAFADEAPPGTPSTAFAVSMFLALWAPIFIPMAALVLALLGARRFAGGFALGAFFFPLIWFGFAVVKT